MAFLTPSEECNRLKPCRLHIHSQINGTYSLCVRRICMIRNPSAQHIILQLSANPGLKLATLSPRIAVELIITVIRSLLDEIGFGIVPVAHRPSVHAGTPGSGFNKQSACVEPTHMSVAVHRCVQTTWTFTWWRWRYQVLHHSNDESETCPHGTHAALNFWLTKNYWNHAIVNL